MFVKDLFSSLIFPKVNLLPASLQHAVTSPVAHGFAGGDGGTYSGAGGGGAGGRGKRRSRGGPRGGAPGDGGVRPVRSRVGARGPGAGDVTRAVVRPGGRARALEGGERQGDRGHRPARAEDEAGPGPEVGAHKPAGGPAGRRDRPRRGRRGHVRARGGEGRLSLVCRRDAAGLG